MLRFGINISLSQVCWYFIQSCVLIVEELHNIRDLLVFFDKISILEYNIAFKSLYKETL